MKACCVEWLRQGMPFGAPDAPHVDRPAGPSGRAAPGRQASSRFSTTAVYSDGSSARCDDRGRLRQQRRPGRRGRPRGLVRTGTHPGEAAITVHYMGHVAAVRVRRAAPDRPQPYPNIPTNNRIDELAWAKWKEMGIVPSDLCDDATFLAPSLPRRHRHIADPAEECGRFLPTRRPTSGSALDRPVARARPRIRGLLGAAVVRHPAGGPRQARRSRRLRVASLAARAVRPQPSLRSAGCASC